MNKIRPGVMAIGAGEGIPTSHFNLFYKISFALNFLLTET